MVTIGGMFSGLDTNSIIQQLTALNRQPITTLQATKFGLDSTESAFGFVATSLQTLRSRLNSVGDSELFTRKAAALSDASIGTATASAEAASGSVDVEITQLATSSLLSGAKATALPASTATVSQVFGASAAGTLTINGNEVTLTESMTLQEVATALTAALDGGTATYDQGTGRFTLQGTAPLALGSGTSDFLQQAQLFNNTTSTVSSATAIGRLDSTRSLSELLPGLGASGSLSINGQSIAWSATDSLSTVLGRITNSEAGVVAAYDAYNDRILLSAKNRGAASITVSDTSGSLADRLNFRTGSGGEASVALGRNTEFKVNGGATRTSLDSTIDASELGLPGVSLNASKVGSTTITVRPDTAGIKSAIDDFINQYNSSQNLISSYLKVDPGNSSNNGALANEGSLTFLPSELRSAVTSPIGSGTNIRMLEDLGIAGSGDSNTLSVADADKLEAALRDHPDEVIAIFTDFTSGLGARLGGVLDAYESNPNSVINTRKGSITQQKTQIDRDIELLEARVAAETEYLRASFATLEAASSQAQQFSSFFSQTTSK